MRCEWCKSKNVSQTNKPAYWELPDGTKALQINQIPSILCNSCKMNYIEERIVTEIEDQLFLIDTKELPHTIGYKELMDRPRLLKKNYFNF
ncbi:YokU family protein [Bacillus sp. FJAT-45350]|uniref:YokU family protein n=1 Tax=Bacillus sp. FJAT-45350 TaxID=2011014 RepID=UPI000BB7ACBD|nr:YokU family protein [Bacillus sp. FJAT-45350]